MKEFDDVILVEPITTAINQVVDYKDELFEFDPVIDKVEVNTDMALLLMGNPNKKRVHLPMQAKNTGQTFIDPKYGLNVEGTNYTLDGRVDELSEELNNTIRRKPNTSAGRTAR